MKIEEASESGDSSDWNKVLISSKVASWTDEDCRSVMSALTTNTIPKTMAADLWEKLEGKKIRKRRKEWETPWGACY